MAGPEKPDNSSEKPSLFIETVKELPSAAAELAREAWQHKGATAVHVFETVSSAAVMGVVLGHLIPARGPAAWIAGAALSLPLAISSYDRIAKAHKQLERDGVNEEKVAHYLARDTIRGLVDFGLTFGAAYGGTEAGHLTSKSGGMIGELGQASQRSVLKGENHSLSLATRLMRPLVNSEREVAAGLPAAKIISGRPGGLAGADVDATIASAFPKPLVEPEFRSGVSRHLGIIDRRIGQFEQNGKVVNRELSAILDPTAEYKVYTGSLHGHSKYSDGMLTPEEIFLKAKKEGEHVTTITDHNHELARTGVGKEDPRAKDESGTPILTANPIQYAETFAAAARITEPGRNVALVGLEVGTIGKPGTPHHGAVGVNHFGLLEVPTFYESTVVRRHALDAYIFSPLRRLFGMSEPPPVVKAPDVIKIADGDAKAFADHLSRQKATDGGTPIIVLNHPRASAELADSVPKELQFADYGKLSFDPAHPTKSIKLWFEHFAKPYVRQMEVIKGEALNPNPTDTVKAKDIDLHSYLVYLDRGLKASPAFGRDFHYGDPVGRPAGTIFLSRALDKPSILETLRARRTGVTTSRESLVGSLWANESHPMGSILDQAAVNKLDLKVKIGGNVQPEAQYTVKLIGDKIGDGKLGKVIQTKELTGRELLDADNQVAFDSIQHVLGNKSAYMVQVDRTTPALGDYVDHMWTAPIWVEPLAGEKHSMFARAMAGYGGGLAGNAMFAPILGDIQR